MKKKQKKTASPKDPRRALPSVSALLIEPAIELLIPKHSRAIVLETVREVIASVGTQLMNGDAPPKKSDLVSRIALLLEEKDMDSLRPVVNATGIVLHTGLGRAPLTKEAANALSQLHQCCNLQVDMEIGARGKRNYMTEQLLCRLSGAEAAMVVNNNAAATFLLLLTMCKDKEVIVSRGQLIEIGGSFRLPDCMRQSGAIMKEVGTTNKTHLRDYEQALSENTGAVLRVFPSNYRVVGFTKQVSIAELASLKKKHSFILIDDLGCGALIDLEKMGLPKEPTVQESIADGADLVCSSGDKLIGGPQAGIILGRRDLIQKIKKHPMTRMLRVCKMTDIALEQTLRLFLDPETLIKRHPVLRMLCVSAEDLKRKALRLKRRLEKENPSLSIEVVEDKSAVGGGTMPDHPLKTYSLALGAKKRSPEELCRQLMQNEPPVIARISNNQVLLDMRTLLPGEERVVEEAIKGIAVS